MVSSDLFSKGASGNVPGPTFLPKVAATEKLHNAAGGVWWLNRLFRMTRTNQEVSPWNIQRRIAWPPADVHLAWPLRKDVAYRLSWLKNKTGAHSRFGGFGSTCEHTTHRL